jgi:hypothetical protein
LAALGGVARWRVRYRGGNSARRALVGVEFGYGTQQFPAMAKEDTKLLQVLIR